MYLYFTTTTTNTTITTFSKMYVLLGCSIRVFFIIIFNRLSFINAQFRHLYLYFVIHIIYNFKGN